MNFIKISENATFSHNEKFLSFHVKLFLFHCLTGHRTK